MRSCILTLMLVTMALPASEAPSVVEIGLAAPDIIVVAVTEAPIDRGHIQERPADGTPTGTWITVDGRDALIIGPQASHIRFADRHVGARLDRSAVDNAGGYAISGPGSPTVTAVYRKSTPVGQGIRNGGSFAVMEHLLFLHCDGALDEGSYTITFPGSQLPATAFGLDFTATRSRAIHINQSGFAPGDSVKQAFLSLWLPNGPNDGAVDFRSYDGAGDFDLGFNIVDEAGSSVASGSATLRMGPTDSEEGGKGPHTYERYDGSTWQANRASTWVFEMDFSPSTWSDPQPGTYRLVVPGLGCSAPFEIADDRWHRNAALAIQGLYNHRSGIELDGRFGYSRPRDFHPADGVPIYHSRMPITMSKEGYGGGLYGYNTAVEPAFLTSDTHPEAWGGWMDAGDWDRRGQHLESSYMILDLFELLPEAAQRADYGLPPISTVLDAPHWDGVDLPDMLDEALWNLDLFHRLQRSDGAVHGGIEHAGGDGPGGWHEPSWLSSKISFVYAPDPHTSYKFAGTAAKASLVLTDLAPAAAAVYRQAALDAWDWAEAASGDRSIAYDDAFDARDAHELANGGLAFTESERESTFQGWVSRSASARMFAAGALFRLTGESRFDTAFQSHIDFKSDGSPSGSNDPQGDRQQGMWEYWLCDRASADQGIRDWVASKIPSHTRTWMTGPISDDAVAFPALKHKAAQLGWGTGAVPSQLPTYSAIRSEVLTGTGEFDAVLVEASGVVLGANPIDRSLTIGLGDHQVRHPLHVDHIAMGVAPPRGITIYGFMPWDVYSAWWLYDASWSDMFVGDPERRVSPSRKAIPIFESVLEHPGLVPTMEYTIQQSITTTFCIWAWLGRNGSHGPLKRSILMQEPEPARLWSITPTGSEHMASDRQLFYDLDAGQDHQLEAGPSGAG